MRGQFVALGVIETSLDTGALAPVHFEAIRLDFDPGEGGCEWPGAPPWPTACLFGVISIDPRRDVLPEHTVGDVVDAALKISLEALR